MDPVRQVPRLAQGSSEVASRSSCDTVAGIPPTKGTSRAVLNQEVDPVGHLDELDDMGVSQRSRRSRD